MVAEALKQFSLILSNVCRLIIMGYCTSKTQSYNDMKMKDIVNIAFELSRN